MKVFAHYDAKGTIRSLISFQAPEGFSLGLIPQSGVFIAEVDGVKLESKENDLEKLAETARTYRIATPMQRGKLEKQSNPKG
jgi:hypothetical protein